MTWRGPLPPYPTIVRVLVRRLVFRWLRALTGSPLPPRYDWTGVLRRATAGPPPAPEPGSRVEERIPDLASSAAPRYTVATPPRRSEASTNFWPGHSQPASGSRS